MPTQQEVAVVDVPPVSTTPNAYGPGLVSAHPHAMRGASEAP